MLVPIFRRDRPALRDCGRLAQPQHLQHLLRLRLRHPRPAGACLLAHYCCRQPTSRRAQGRALPGLEAAGLNEPEVVLPTREGSGVVRCLVR